MLPSLSGFGRAWRDNPCLSNPATDANIDTAGHHEITAIGGQWDRVAVQDVEALVRAGDRVSALKQARIYEVLLSQELKLPPDRDVIALAERIRAMESAPSAPP
ncbi:MAG TPA: hypothetical protein VM076_05260, partial [Gemmatimonadaceae bacterium]|nr:hypothetical protein [Gemmatimonadaceae bacterium]